MRYAIISKGLELKQMESECRRLGAENIRLAPAMRQLFCDLGPEAMHRLLRTPGLAVKPIKTVKVEETAVAVQEVLLSQMFYELRASLDPPLTGSGLTVAVLDSGIKKSHESFDDGKVVHEAFQRLLAASAACAHETAKFGREEFFPLFFPGVQKNVERVAC